MLISVMLVLFDALFFFSFFFFGIFATKLGVVMIHKFETFP